MKNVTHLFSSGPFSGFALCGEPGKFDPQIGDGSKKGPPEKHC